MNQSELMRRYLEDYAIACLAEAVCGSVRLNPFDFVVLLQACYDRDVLEEESILRWAESYNPTCQLVSDQNYKHLQKAAQPFVKWLKEAEIESSSLEGED